MALFALVGTILLGGLIWVDWRLQQQDHALDAQRIRERLESAASLICREMDRALAGWEQLLVGAIDGASVPVPHGAVLALFDSSGIVRHLGAPLLYQPVTSPSLPVDIFSAAEILEFREGNCTKASALYRELAQSPQRPVKAGALMRLARCLRKERKMTEALAVYGQMTDLGDAPAAGTPAALLARKERMVIFQSLGDQENRGREAMLLAAALDGGTFRIDRATYEFFREFLPTPAASPENDRKRALAEAVAAIWSRRLQAPDGIPARMLLPESAFPHIALMRKTPEGAAVLLAGCDELMASLEGSPREMHVRVQLIEAQGRSVWGENPGGNTPQVMKTSLETGLPWSVRVAISDSSAELALSASRRRQLHAGLAVIALALGAAGYAIFRAVTREMRVAALQSDFVAAVSHEFRTPLAAMCHLTESLEDNRVDEKRRPDYYQALARESRRLKEMVESLLDFARMESGRQMYAREELDIADLVRGGVEAFQERNSASGRRINLDLPSPAGRVRGDPEALARALRNLLDNAAKYSPAGSPIRVALCMQGDRVEIAIQDQGAGIPKAEQREIFRKFVRGASARSLNVKGTGIGLAMVRHIVEDHGGQIEVTSEPGQGSCFTMHLPLRVETDRTAKAPRPQSHSRFSLRS